MKLGGKIIAIATMLVIINVNSVFAGNGNQYDFSERLPLSEAQQHVTRGEFAHYLANLMQSKDIRANADYEGSGFADVSTENIYCNDILYLRSLEIVQGIDDDTFRPDDIITYKEAAAIITRAITADYQIVEAYGEYPTGYLKYATVTGLFNFTVTVDSPVTLGRTYEILNSLDSHLKVYDVLEKLGCDTYNGKVYIDCYPKSWQGYAYRPQTTNQYAYYRILPEKLLYSYDNKTWHILYEDIDGERIYPNLPEGIDMDKVRYDRTNYCFESVPDYTEDAYYSYDYIEWIQGNADGEVVKSEIYEDSEKIIYGIPMGVCTYNEEADLYFAHYPYYSQACFSQMYQSEFTDIRDNMVWVSKDGKIWIGLKEPDGVEFYVGMQINRYAKALMVTCAVEFTEEEKAYLDEEERIAKEKDLAYDKPSYKQEIYMVSFDTLNALFE